MRIKSGLIVILGLALISEAMSDEEVQTVLGEQGKPSETLSKEQLLKALDDYIYAINDAEKIAYYVYSQLLKTRSKENTEVVNGVTVAELIAQKEFHSLESECTKAAFKRRAGVYAKTIPTDGRPEGGVAFGVNVYALRWLRGAVVKCFDSRFEVVQKEIMDGDFLIYLYREFRSGDSKERDPKKAVMYGIYSQLALKIEKDAKENAYDY